jgi:hypothetical protein
VDICYITLFERLNSFATSRMEVETSVGQYAKMAEAGRMLVEAGCDWLQPAESPRVGACGQMPIPPPSCSSEATEELAESRMGVETPNRGFGQTGSGRLRSW